MFTHTHTVTSSPTQNARTLRSTTMSTEDDTQHVYGWCSTMHNKPNDDCDDRCNIKWETTRQIEFVFGLNIAHLVKCLDSVLYIYGWWTVRGWWVTFMQLTNNDDNDLCKSCLLVESSLDNHKTDLRWVFAFALSGCCVYWHFIHLNGFTPSVTEQCLWSMPMAVWFLDEQFWADDSIQNYKWK